MQKKNPQQNENFVVDLILNSNNVRSCKLQLNTNFILPFWRLIQTNVLL